MAPRVLAKRPPGLERPRVVGAIVLWLGVFTRIAQYWRRNRLGLVDFDAAFFRNLLYSEAFPIDLAYWVVQALLDTVAMAFLCGCFWQ